MEAERLRIGEERRDASTKIRGFLYQDLLTLKVLSESDNETKVYCEWVEDIYTENDGDISIIQAKYYPASTVKFSDIFEDMYYQFLKVKLYKINKSVSLKCYYHGDTEFSKETCVSDFVYGNVHKDLSDEEIQSILVKIKECSNMSERKNLIFSNLNKQQFMDEFNLDIIKTGTIDDLYIAVKEALFNEYNNVGLLSRIDNTQAKDILISIFVSLIQTKYYSGSELVDDRFIDKGMMKSHLKELLETEDENAYRTLIIATMDNVIDHIYLDVLEETVDNQEVLKEYERLSTSTKQFFKSFFAIKENRYKFINTISMQSYEELNLEKYSDLTFNEEFLLFVENKLKINSYIKTLWKIIFSLESKSEINDVLRANNDYVEFVHENESTNLVLLSSELSSDATREYKKFLKRARTYRERPHKWYLRNCLKGIHNYDYDISDIDRDQLDISKIENENRFQVECMKCIKCDYKKMETKDNLHESIFSNKCMED